jgi:hypothetical protein
LSQWSLLTDCIGFVSVFSSSGAHLRAKFLDFSHSGAQFMFIRWTRIITGNKTKPICYPMIESILFSCIQQRKKLRKKKEKKNVEDVGTQGRRANLWPNTCFISNCWVVSTTRTTLDLTIFFSNYNSFAISRAVRIPGGQWQHISVQQTMW